MSTGTLSKVPLKTAGEICKLFELTEDGKKLLKENQTPKQFLDLLNEKNLFKDAMRFLAFALPKREAVWWGCQCVRFAFGKNLAGKYESAVQAAEKWVAGPTEDTRWGAKKAADVAKLDTPSGMLAMAAFWSGGSMIPDNPKMQPVPPPEAMTAKTVTGAVLISPFLIEPVKAPEKKKKFVALGIEVGSGTNRWKDAPAPPPAAAPKPGAPVPPRR
jgi:hypothetical protein